MRYILLSIGILASSSVLAFDTVPEYAKDFASARECKEIDGRKVWAGEDAYYIQSWLFMTGDSGLLDPENASAVPLADNTAEDLTAFAVACK